MKTTKEIKSALDFTSQLFTVICSIEDVIKEWPENAVQKIYAIEENLKVLPSSISKRGSTNPADILKKYFEELPDTTDDTPPTPTATKTAICPNCNNDRVSFETIVHHGIYDSPTERIQAFNDAIIERIVCGECGNEWGSIEDYETDAGIINDAPNDYKPGHPELFLKAHYYCQREDDFTTAYSKLGEMVESELSENTFEYYYLLEDEICQGEISETIDYVS